jgi:hypothetical protein
VMASTAGSKCAATACEDIDWLFSDRRDPHEVACRPDDDGNGRGRNRAQACPWAFSPQTMAVVKRFAVNPVQTAKPITSLKNRRKLAGWDFDYLEAVILEVA